MTKSDWQKTGTVSKPKAAAEKKEVKSKRLVCFWRGFAAVVVAVAVAVQ